MTTDSEGSSFVGRYLGPLVPLALAAFGIWILISGHYSFRPGRSTTTVTLLPPDSQFAALFFLSLAVLLAAFGAKGQMERWLFWVGLVGSVTAIVTVGARQIIGAASYG
jgi:hypothetical protein